MQLFASLLFSLFISAFSTISCTDKVAFPEAAPGALTFIGNAGSDNVFVVERWKFDQLENLDAPTEIQVAATLDMTSITTGWKELQESVKKKKDYFHTGKFATATVHINGATQQEDGTYTTDAQLKLKGITQPVSLQFSLTLQDSTYALEASGTVVRQAFNFKDKGPKNEVPISLSAVLPR